MLEKQLDILDSTERTSLFLASISLDGNTERQGVLDRIETVLIEYGKTFSPCAGTIHKQTNS
jgi:hypothetical protein